MKRRSKYDLYQGAKNSQDFIELMEQKVENDPPEVNISEIVDHFFRQKLINGVKPHSNKQVF